MADKILCPWCGAEMRVYIDEQGVFDYNAWTECTNNKCTADGPLVTGYETSEEAEEAARAAALRRYTPNKWISVNDRLPEADGKYIVCTTKGSVYCAKFTARHGVSFHTDMNTHIAYWMPMPDKPTDEERSAAEWEA